MYLVIRALHAYASHAELQKCPLYVRCAHSQRAKGAQILLPMASNGSFSFRNRISFHFEHSKSTHTQLTQIKWAMCAIAHAQQLYYLESIPEFMAQYAVQQRINACRHEIQDSRNVCERRINAAKDVALRTRRFPIDGHQALCMEWCPA